MKNGYDVTVTPAEAETPWGDGAYTLSCTCGETVTYRGYWFTQVEAHRHLQYHQGIDAQYAQVHAQRYSR